jgi:integrase
LRRLRRSLEGLGGWHCCALGIRREGLLPLVQRTVKRVAACVGIDEVHAHSIHAAFAVRFLETHVGDLEALQALMRHKKIETTQVYLRRLNRSRAMERVRDLSSGASTFDAFCSKGA